MLQISDKVKAICKDHYSKCDGSCPIRVECTEKYQMTIEEHNKHIDMLNTKAKDI